MLAEVVMTTHYSRTTSAVEYPMWVSSGLQLCEALAEPHTWRPPGDHQHTDDSRGTRAARLVVRSQLCSFCRGTYGFVGESWLPQAEEAIGELSSTLRLGRVNSCPLSLYIERVPSSSCST